MDNNIEKIDLEEYGNQLREQLLKTPHAIKFEAIIPPIDLEEMAKSEKEYSGVEPYIARNTNDGCNAMTLAMLLYSLKTYIKKELEKPEIRLAYEYLDTLISHSICFGTEDIRKGKSDE